MKIPQFPQILKIDENWVEHGELFLLFQFNNLFRSLPTCRFHVKHGVRSSVQIHGFLFKCSLSLPIYIYIYIADFNFIFLKIFQVSFYIIPTIKLPTICHPTRQIPDVSFRPKQVEKDTLESFGPQTVDMLPTWEGNIFPGIPMTKWGL